MRSGGELSLSLQTGEECVELRSGTVKDSREDLCWVSGGAVFNKPLSLAGEQGVKSFSVVGAEPPDVVATGVIRSVEA